MKVCTVCFVSKPLAEFHRSRRAKDGHVRDCKSCVRIRHQAWYERNRESIHAKQRARYQTQVPAHKLRAREWALENPERRREIRQASQRRNQARNRAKVRLAVFNAYGGAVCACCGETEVLFLTLDHVNNDGADHRKSLGHRGDVWRDLRSRGYPPGFQVLCRNCNWGKHVNRGACPHQMKAVHGIEIKEV